MGVGQQKTAPAIDILDIAQNGIRLVNALVKLLNCVRESELFQNAEQTGQTFKAMKQLIDKAAKTTLQSKVGMAPERRVLPQCTQSMSQLIVQCFPHFSNWSNRMGELMEGCLCS